MKRPRYTIVRLEGNASTSVLSGLTVKMAGVLVRRFQLQAPQGVTYSTNPPLPEEQNEEIETHDSHPAQPLEGEAGLN